MADKEDKSKAAAAPATPGKTISKSERSQLFARLEAQLAAYQKTPGAVVAAVDPRKPPVIPADYVSTRIQKPSQSKGGEVSNQFRSTAQGNGVAKGGGATFHWQAVSEAAPQPTRVGMSLSPIGAGHLRRLVLFGGIVEPHDDLPSGGFAPSDLELFDPTRLQWCTPDQRGSVKGRPPTPRVGHSAAPFGRHLVLVFGGRTDGGLSSELFALGQHRCKALHDVSCPSPLIAPEDAARPLPWAASPVQSLEGCPL